MRTETVAYRGAQFGRPTPGEMTPGRRADAADPASDKINCRTQVIAVSPPVQTPDRGKERKAGGFDRLRVEHTTRRPTFRVELPVLPDTSTVELHRNSIQECRERPVKRMKDAVRLIDGPPLGMRRSGGPLRAEAATSRYPARIRGGPPR